MKMIVSNRRQYCCTASDQADLTSYYVQQVGNGGSFSGARSQIGSGFGSFFSGLFRKAAPYLKRIGSQVLRSGARLASDVLGGESLKESARMRAREGINEYLDGPPVEQTGSGLRRGYKRDRSSRSHGRIASKKKKKKRHIHKPLHDIFT